MPVFKRESSNKMYSPTAYFWGRITSNALAQVFYPINCVLIVFWGLSIDTSLTNFAMFILYAVLTNFEAISLGFFLGSLMKDVQAAAVTLVLFQLLFMLTSGGLGNVDSFPTVIKWVSYANP